MTHEEFRRWIETSRPILWAMAALVFFAWRFRVADVEARRDSLSDLRQTAMSLSFVAVGGPEFSEEEWDWCQAVASKHPISLVDVMYCLHCWKQKFTKPPPDFETMFAVVSNYGAVCQTKEGYYGPFGYEVDTYARIWRQHYRPRRSR